VFGLRPSDFGAVPNTEHRTPHTRTPQDPSPRPPVRLALVLDASGSMHRIMLEGREREHWRQVGEERGDLKRGRVDGREGWLWSGRTLAELQAQHRTPMQAALRALIRTGERLGPEDSLAVIAFADRARQLVAADSAERAGQIRAAVDLLSEGLESTGLGDGTRLAEGLRLAWEEAQRVESGEWRVESSSKAVFGLPLNSQLRTLNPPRLLLISDGLLEDRMACGAWVERLAEAGIRISCIGVGDQFDEEWLMWAADATRGWFRYAPTAAALETAVAEELGRLETLAARRLFLRLCPLGGALFRDLCQVSPDLSALHRMETDGAAYRFSLGDLSEGQDGLFVAELALPPLALGRHPVLAVELTGENAGGEPLSAMATEAVVRAGLDLTSAAVDPADLEAIAAVHAYRAERRAQRALRSGRAGEATRHLRDTRQIVERLGRPELAAELEAQAAALETGARLSPEREKRIKAGTRRLIE
jgi:Ca-activated chloride channel homolog